MSKKQRGILLAGTVIALPIAYSVGFIWDFSKVLAAVIGVIAFTIDLGSVLWADAIEDR